MDFGGKDASAKKGSVGLINVCMFRFFVYTNVQQLCCYGRPA